MITLRRATVRDAKVLFAWRNDAETRHKSRTTAPVEWEDHTKWLSASLKNPDRVLVIAEENGTPFGTARADLRDDGFTEISYTIAPTMRGKGLSKTMVITFVKEYLIGKKVAADIKKGHTPSESVARALGLTPHHETPSEDPGDPRPHVEWR